MGKLYLTDILQDSYYIQRRNELINCAIICYDLERDSIFHNDCNKAHSFKDMEFDRKSVL